MSPSDPLDALITNRDRFLALLGGIDPEAWSRAPAGGGWSVAEIADHITVVERKSGRFLAGPFLELEVALSAGETTGKEESIRTRMADPTPRPAPDIVQPCGKWSTPAALGEAFAEARNATIALGRSHGPQLSVRVAPHPAFGPLTGTQWLFFLPEHCERHCGQMERMLVIGDRR